MLLSLPADVAIAGGSSGRSRGGDDGGPSGGDDGGPPDGNGGGPPENPDGQSDGGGRDERSFLAAPIDPWTYRSLAYVMLAFPLGIAYLTVLATGLAMTVGLSVTLLGPIALVTLLLSIVGLAWIDGAITRLLLAVDVDPGLPGTDEGAVAFLAELALGRRTWLGAVYLCFRIVLGVVGFVVVIVGISLATGLLATPLLYGEQVVVTLGPGIDRFAIDTFPRALGAAGVGALVALATLYLTNVMGRASAAVATGLLGPRM